MSYAIGSLPRPNINITVSPTLTPRLSPVQLRNLELVNDKLTKATKADDDAAESNTGLIVGGLALAAVAFLALRR